MITREQQIDARLKAREATVAFKGAHDWRPRDKDGNPIDTTGWAQEPADRSGFALFNKMHETGDFSPLFTGILPK